MYEHVRPILKSALHDDAPDEALFQARDIFETIFVAAQKSGHIPEINTTSEAERRWLHTMLNEHHIDGDISFQTLLGCADKILRRSDKNDLFQARCLFRLMLNALSFQQ